MQDTLSLLDAAMDQCEAEGEQAARAIIDRLAVDLLACIREQSMGGRATHLRAIPNAARP